jgi:lysozyme family protein
MMSFDEAFSRLLVHEGNFSDHKADTGGKTCYGITEAVAREAGYSGDMRELPLDKAKAIYRSSYWNPMRCEQMPEALRYDIFDGAVNSGVGQSIKWLQRALGVPDDGKMGPVTIGTANFQNPQSTLARYNGHRLLFMTNVASWGFFGKGWARRIADNLLKA